MASGEILKQSEMFVKTQRTSPRDESSWNARLLLQAGYIDKVAAGVYTYLPLGLRVLRKIQQIVRDEMLGLGAQEILMPALHPKELWSATGRWQDPGPTVMFQFKGHGHQEFGLGWTHEEIVTPLAKRHLGSYRDLPFAVFQIQDKFRNEPRAKSGLLRGREFSMKDLYSFHADRDDLEQYYQRTIGAYQRVFERCGLQAVLTEASGGAFAKYSHEFQVITPYGEDVIFACDACHYAQNREITQYHAGDHCPQCNGAFREEKAIETGNIFKLGTRFSEPFGLTYLDRAGKPQPVVMGCYGIGPSRVMGAVVEVHHDDHGIRWPDGLAPFTVHLVLLDPKVQAVRARAEAAAAALTDAGASVLYDDREVASTGEKFNDADLIGLPWRLVVSRRTGEGVEWKRRSESESHRGHLTAFVKRLPEGSTR